MSGGLGGRRRWARILLLGAAICPLWVCGSAFAQEAVLQEEPPPSSVEQSAVAIDRTFQEPVEHVTIREYLKEALKKAPPFIRDTKLSLNLRTYYLYKDKFDDTFSEAWAIGGGLTYKSGYLLEHFALGAALYTSQPLYAPDDRDGTLLLQSGQDGYTVLGQLYGEIRVTDRILVDLYRQEVNTPYINKNDNRMTPNTFEAYSIRGRTGGEEGEPEVTWGAGYVTKIKERNSDSFVWMSQDAGVSVDRGVFVAGGKFTQKDFTFGVVDYYSEDIINIFYAEAKYTLMLEGGIGLLFSPQFTHQMSTGDDLLTGSSFSTNQFGFKAEVSWGGALLSIGYTKTATGSDMRNPWSSYPGCTSVQVQDFNRAGEQALILKAVYDFSKLGLKGVTVYALWVHGWDRQTGPEEEEFDADLQWRPKNKALKGLWFRVRYAYVTQRGESDATQQDFRVIVNWDF